ncbi:SPW repeat domain-containing protein [Amycolatopsis nigrescens]|uniref:SPW repeat domain-containing protein n=1 Tax=Amycolatopsis nigrescens TaxID=381445 RepID=UPI00037F6C3F|nr:SPW repeat protein [Amycolatopsis nigrescens]
MGVGSGLALLAGLYLILSPWVTRSIDHFGLVASNLITGIAVALLAVAFARSFERLRSLAWVTPVIGVWVIASPWLVFRGSGLAQLELAGVPALSTAAWLSDVIAGVVIVVAGIALVSAARTASR